MKKRKPVRAVASPEYPDVDRYRCTRREFLKSCGAGAVGLAAVTFGGSFLLEGCFPLAGDAMDPDYASDTSSGMTSVRLPESGTWSAYLSQGDYVTYSVTFQTPSDSVVGYFTPPPEETSTAVSGAINATACTALQGTELASIESGIHAALLQQYKAATGNGAELFGVTLAVETCDETQELGGVADVASDYPDPDAP